MSLAMSRRSRRYASSCDIYRYHCGKDCVFPNVIPALFDGLPRDEIDRPAKNLFEIRFHPGEVKKGVHRAWPEIHHYIDVAIRVEITP